MESTIKLLILYCCLFIILLIDRQWYLAFFEWWLFISELRPCLLWDVWTLTILFFFSFIFLILYWFSFLFSFIFLLDDEEVHDTAVTWQVTWDDVIGLEHGGRIWKMMSGHIYTTWWPWVGNEADMRMKHGHEGRFNYC